MESSLEPRPGDDSERFTGVSESEFRAWFYARNAKRAHLTLGLAQLLVLLTAAIDLTTAPEAGRGWVLIKLALICPLPFITLWVYRKPRWKHLFPHFMCGSILAVALAFSLIGIDGPDFRLRYDALVLITVFTYFLGGLASNLAAATGLVLMGVYVAGAYASDTELLRMSYEGGFLLAVNAIGMLSARNVEFSVHEAFARARVLDDLSARDPLTHLLNRRGFNQRFDMVWKQAQRDGKSLAIAMVDLDNFKQVNDRQGHAAGDQALRAVAGALAATATRPLDLTARWGGEEFVLVWFDVTRNTAQKLAERLRLAVAALRIPNEVGGRSVLTVSIGVYACRPKPGLTREECVEYADQAQYQAKQSGRDRVVVI